MTSKAPFSRADRLTFAADVCALAEEDPNASPRAEGFLEALAVAAAGGDFAGPADVGVGAWRPRVSGRLLSQFSTGGCPGKWYPWARAALQE